jgi:carbonic anhydrase
MGHSKCGAIEAVHDADGKPLPLHLRAIQSHMHDLDEEVHKTHADHSQATLDRLSEENARMQTKAMLSECKLLRDAVDAGKVKIVTMEYDINSGEAKVLSAPK